jgi:hypothetical protein
MFTADLKSFADYNMPLSPSPQKKSTTTKRKREVELGGEVKDYLPTPPITPGPMTLSKAAITAATNVLEAGKSNLYSEAVKSSIADRVKRRRNI